MQMWPSGSSQLTKGGVSSASSGAAHNSQKIAAAQRQAWDSG